MKRCNFSVWLLVVGFSSVSLAGTLPDTVRQAGASDEQQSAAAVATLRQRGPNGLDELFRLRDELVAQHADADLAALDLAIDRVGGQRYCTASRLFWHTDWESARAAALASGKPILSLRMLGKLTDELSCANSRFFRTTLYANREISQFLRENFVLHWKSVRPVPKLTIDFGDGRKLERTITGNSIHYVLTPDGEVVDGLPGLYSPAEFLAKLRTAKPLADGLTQLAKGASPQVTPEMKDWAVKQYHTERLNRISRTWQDDLARIGAAEQAVQAALAQNAGGPGQRQENPPPAEKAAEVARPKALVELPVLKNITMRLVKLDQDTDEATWQKIAALHEAKLDAASLELIRRQNPTATAAAALALTKARTESPLVRLVANLQASIALDTVRNEYLLHRRIHEWLVDGFAAKDVEKLNERVYAELFLTPSSDPWLGLVPADVYSAIQNNGIASSP